MFKRDRGLSNKELYPHYYNILHTSELPYFKVADSFTINFNPYDSKYKLRELMAKNDEISKKLKDELISRSELGHPKKYNGNNNRNKEFPQKSINTTPKDEIFYTYLDLKIAIFQKVLKHCQFCENRCGVDRTSKEIKVLGKCGLNKDSYVASAFLHYGEESVLVPSGTIFFMGCSFDCIYCQNWDISSFGKNADNNLLNADLYQLENERALKVDAKKLAQIADKLAKSGAKNINYVGGDPTPNLHTIVHSMKYQNYNSCQLWNSNFYNSKDVLDVMKDLFDFWLPDFKYGNNECGEILSGIPRYYDVITRNLKMLYDYGVRDVIIRHLVLPGHFECCTKPVLEWVAKNTPEFVVNIMGQYHPDYKVLRNAIDSSDPKIKPLNRRVTNEEMSKAISLGLKLGLRIL
ncbi:MAG: radical SAM protein [Promethearchaeota archaeon]